MSIHLMTQAWKCGRPSGQKFVLLALCDNANDEGMCYPSISTIAAKCGMGERTVQGHITEMELDGALVREMRNGRSTIYHLYPVNFDSFGAPADFAPPQNPHPTPAENSTKPPQPSHPSPAGFAPRTTSKRSKPPMKRELARATRLPCEWKLPMNWGMWAQQKFPSWSTDFIRDLAESFRDHWIAVGGQRGCKTDWEATWRNWCRNESRTPRAGNSGGGAWWASESGILAKGVELGMAPLPGESMPSFQARIRATIDNGGKRPEPAPTRLPQPFTPLPDSKNPNAGPAPASGRDEARRQLKSLKNIVKKDPPQRKKQDDE